jgi:hypothetical protein
MKDEVLNYTPIGNLTKVVEEEKSEAKTKSELNIPDPKPEKALGVLIDSEGIHEHKVSKGLCPKNDH